MQSKQELIKLLLAFLPLKMCKNAAIDPFLYTHIIYAILNSEALFFLYK